MSWRCLLGLFQENWVILGFSPGRCWTLCPRPLWKAAHFCELGWFGWDDYWSLFLSEKDFWKNMWPMCSSPCSVPLAHPFHLPFAELKIPVTCILCFLFSSFKSQYLPASTQTIPSPSLFSFGSVDPQSFSAPACSHPCPAFLSLIAYQFPEMCQENKPRDLSYLLLAL